MKKEFVMESLAVNEKRHLTIGGVDTVELAKEYGTPLFVMDEEYIRSQCRRYSEALNKSFGEGKALALYASKAFSVKAIYPIIAQEGLGADVLSGGEIFTARSAGFPMERAYFHGNNKSAKEIAEAVDAGLGCIVVDHLGELDMVSGAAAKSGRSVPVMFRVKPGVDAHTHKSIRTGNIDSKFGFAYETGEAMDAIEKALGYSNLEVVGIHCHIGSQIFDTEHYEEAIAVMLGFMNEVREKTGTTLTQLNLGGGFGVAYLHGTEHMDIEGSIALLAKSVKSESQKLGFPIPKILLEPGRSIVAAAGLTLYTVGSLKKIPGVRTYFSVDGGMTDNPRYALYKSKYDVVVANRADAPKTSSYTVAGKCCESGDLIGEYVKMQKVTAGDLAAVLVTGAYNFSMASNYNRLTRPGVVFVRGGESRLVVRRESYEDLVRNDL